MMMLSMDLGKFNTVCCFYDTGNGKHRFETIQTRHNHVEHVLSLENVDLVVMEACGPSGWISDLCHEKKLKSIVCSTNDEAWSWKNTKRKTDRDDALKLAKMAVMDALTPVHVPKPEIREQRAIIKYRKMLLACAWSSTRYNHPSPGGDEWFSTAIPPSFAAPVHGICSTSLAAIDEFDAETILNIVRREETRNVLVNLFPREFDHLNSISLPDGRERWQPVPIDRF
jgi:hypothetical protein